jgi:hypothetical protein
MSVFARSVERGLLHAFSSVDDCQSYAARNVTAFATRCAVPETLPCRAERSGFTRVPVLRR